MDIDEIINWSTTNKMILNESKTKSVVITDKRLVKQLEQSSLRLQSDLLNLNK